MKKIIFAMALAILFLPILSIAQNDKKPSNDTPKEQPTQFIYHKVKPGETVFGIAKTYNADVKQIIKLNPGSKDKIWAGATLLVPCTETAIEQPDENDTLHIQEHLNAFIDEMRAIVDANLEDNDDIKTMSKRINALNTKWNVYYQAKQANIADNDALTELVSQYEQLSQAAKDTLDATKNHFQLIADFNKADKFITKQMSVYKELEKQALELSLAEALAPKLEALKAKEQLIFADIEKNYETAKTAAAQTPSLNKRMNQITNIYVEIKSYSEKIQAAEYKPLFARIKDYLFGFAAVTIILMFANMMQTKVQAAKQAKEAAKKLEKFRQTHDDEYPTI